MAVRARGVEFGWGMAISGRTRWGACTAAPALAAGAAQAQTAQKPSGATPTAVAPATIRSHGDDTRAKLDHIQREVDGTKLTVGKKSSVALLDQQPEIPDQSVRGLFVHTPGLVTGEASSATQIDLAYRGLSGQPGSQDVLVLQDGLPISADFMGAPALAWLPFAQGLAQVQTLRAGSGLVYGPQAVAINLLSRRPQPGEPLNFYTEQAGGSDGLWSSWNALEGTSGDLDYRADLGWTRSGGWRANSASGIGQTDAWLGWRPAKGQLWYLDLQAYRASADDPGPMGLAQFDAAPKASLTPYDHDWLSRSAATLGTELDLGQGWRLEGKLRAADQDLDQRSAGEITPGAPPPAAATLQDALFRSEDADVRLSKRWGHGNALTFGVEAAHDDAPLRQWIGQDLTAGQGDHAGAVATLRQARSSDYAAIFAENVFRLPHRIHIVPSVRFEHERIGVEETIKPVGLTRPLIDARATRDTPLFGLGIGNDFGNDNETYVSVSQGWRPLRFFDLASPFTNPPPRSADASRSLSWEGGVHGTPVRGLFYDASLFWIEVKNRVETEALNTIDYVNVNTGDTRNRGFEGEVVYDFWASRSDHAHLSAFSSLALLDARFVRSSLPGEVGRVPAYAPHVLAKAGLTWRRDKAWDLSLAAVSVGSQFFQDSDQPAGEGPSFVPAKIPSYALLDLSGDWWITPRVRLLGGVRNLGDERYYSQALQTGLVPAARRTAYAGLALAF